MCFKHRNKQVAYSVYGQINSDAPGWFINYALRSTDFNVNELFS